MSGQLSTAAGMDWKFDKNNTPALPSSNFLDTQQRRILPQPDPQYSGYESQLGSSMQESRPKKLLQPSPEQWVILKPIIHELYIEKNVTLKGLLGVIAEDHQLKVTMKQLTNQLESWKFWKNKTKNRGTAVPRFDGSHTGRRMAKEEFRRRKQDATCDSKILMQASTTASHEQVMLEQEATTPDIGAPESNLIDTSDQPDGYVEVQTLETPMDITWPFSWTYVDVENSPGLTRLFSHLKIVCGEDIPDFELPPPSVSLNTTFPEYVSAFEVEKGSGDKASDPADELEAHTTMSLIKRSSYTSHSNKKARGIFIHDGFDFPLPRYFDSYHSPSPFNEVYVFPSSPATRTPKRNHLAIFKETDDWDAKLRNFQTSGLLSYSDPRHLKMIRNLVDSCLLQFNISDGEIAEYWCNQLLNNHSSTRYRPEEVLVDRLNLIEAIFNQNQFRKALVTIKDSENGLLKSSNKVLIRFLRLKGLIFEMLHQKTDAEKALRNCLQLCLSSLGPKHEDTMNSMFRLSQCLGLWKESEELLRIALPLGGKELNISYGIKSRLALLMHERRPHEEAVLLGRKIIETVLSHSETAGSVREWIRHTFDIVMCSLLEQGKVGQCIQVAHEYLDFGQSWTFNFLCCLGAISRRFQEEHEGRMLVALLERIEEMAGLTRIIKICYQRVQSIRNETRIANHWDYELRHIKHLEEWYQKQKQVEEEEAVKSVREFVIIED
ncbi:hypothetical protein HYFRA_00010037 [Hymenoscyphus fraxineus]|uniref:Clr5 domain-containing protein n=1 Tax=Hymenoscyphus fraxineus TaxID=746836 RepID=A0A9N9KVV6_9HELO|nr:hypothetical protein HYFRA_00010037 [Hymenoscyphus fraxineus]